LPFVLFILTHSTQLFYLSWCMMCSYFYACITSCRHFLISI
jgi:hypothetical protein